MGRTGTFITIDNVLEQIEKEQVVDIPGAITKIRQKRMKMVQTHVSIALSYHCHIIKISLYTHVCTGSIHIHPRCYPGVSHLWRHTNLSYQSEIHHYETGQEGRFPTSNEGKKHMTLHVGAGAFWFH